MKHTKKHSPGRSQRILFWTVVVIVIGGFAALSPFIFTRSDKDVTIIIPPGATKKTVVDSLLKYYPESYAERVEYLIGLRNIDFAERAGMYKIDKGTTPFTAMRRLTRGSQTPVRLTINHFRTLDTLADAISRKCDFSKDDFLKVAQDPAFLSAYGLTPDQALSLFLEDTYEVYWSWTPRQVIEKIGKKYQTLWNQKNVKRASEMGLTPAQLMIIASITDEETNEIDEKGRIGTLYANRLNVGMRLQADPTVRYAIGNFSIHRVTQEHLKYDSPYNTYIHDGLPPGPIRTTSEKTVTEILNSKPSEELYMCAKEDFSGYHNFAKTYEEHTQNALRYQHELDRRGIK